MGCIYAVNYFTACWGFWRWESCVVYMLWIDWEQFPREYSISEISAGLISCECLHMPCGIVPVPGLNECNNFSSPDFEKHGWCLGSLSSLWQRQRDRSRLGTWAAQELGKPVTLHSSFLGWLYSSPKCRFFYGTGNTLSSKSGSCAPAAFFQGSLSCRR